MNQRTKKPIRYTSDGAVVVVTDVPRPCSGEPGEEAGVRDDAAPSRARDRGADEERGVRAKVEENLLEDVLREVVHRRPLVGLFLLLDLGISFVPPATSLRRRHMHGQKR